MIAGTALADNLTRQFNSPTFPFRIGDTTGRLTLSFGIQVVPEGTEIEGTPYKLASDMVVEVVVECLEDEGPVIARTHLVDEYGIGTSLQEAILDLLASLADYLMSLERRKEQLGEPMLLDLKNLRTLLKKR